MNTESKTEAAENDPTGAQDQTPENQSDFSQASSSLRKTALSKREIMEQLSRERFPWDE
jgi:hypothetical protein